MENELNKNQLPSWEVFVQPKSGASFQHAGNLHAIDEEMALQNARDLYLTYKDTSSLDYGNCDSLLELANQHKK